MRYAQEDQRSLQLSEISSDFLIPGVAVLDIYRFSGRKVQVDGR